MDGPRFKDAVRAATDESQHWYLKAIELVVDYFDTVQDRRVVPNVEPGYLRKLLPDGPPKSGEKWADIQKDIESKIMPGMTHW
ncbi:MAG: hypothetical protein LQ338_000522 [Usnochroma carphineum]|nr:MAG: hypothetical protein LQ338_000522 [Usnochroma carphineum]